MIDGLNKISIIKNRDLLFSICTIITSKSEYALMKQSFVDHGFSDNIEFLVADNTNGNVFDAFTAINRFLQEAAGRFIIIVHQDVRCLDPIDKLISSLNKLESVDPSWAVCGNAGARGYRNFFYYLNDNGRIDQSNNLPARVTSLDENLLIIKSECNLSVSADIKDFHFYGTDICIIADFLGYHCYVIEFMVHHLSSGNIKKMLELQPAFIEHYGHKLRSRFIHTSCTKFYLSNSVFKNKLYNNPFIFFWLKAFTRMSNFIKKLF